MLDFLFFLDYIDVWIFHLYSQTAFGISNSFLTKTCLLYSCFHNCLHSELLWDRLFRSYL